MEFSVCPAGLKSGLGPASPLEVLLLLHFIMGMFTPRHCALEVYTFLFEFCGGSKLSGYLGVSEETLHF